MTLHTLRLTCLLLVTLPAAAFAEEPRAVADSVSYTFEDDLVGGAGRAPEGQLLRVHARKAKESLVRVREHFIPELYKCVEDL